MRHRLSALLALAIGTLAAACHKSPTSPSGSAVAEYIASFTALSGPAAVRQGGSPPFPTGGPTILATASSTAVGSGLDLVALKASAPFQTVYVSVGGTGTGVDGFYKLQLAAATPNADLVLELARIIPVDSFQTVFSVASPSGAVGTSVSVQKTVQTASPTVNVAGTWSGNLTASGGLVAGQLTVTLSQTGPQVTGTFSTSSTSENGTSTGSGNIFGSLYESTLAFGGTHALNSSGCGQQITNGLALVTGTVIQGSVAMMFDTSLACATLGQSGTQPLLASLTKR